MAKRKLLSQAEYARLKKFSRQHVSRLIKLGLIPTVDGRIDLQAADAALKAMKDPARALGKTPESWTFTEARTLRERYRALNEQLTYQERHAEVIEAAKVTALLEKVCTTFRTRCLAVPRKLAPLLVGLDLPQRAEAVLTKEIHELLRELARLNISTLMQERK
jgi:hypothetical protein